MPSPRTRGREGPGSAPRCLPGRGSRASGKPAFVGKGEQEERHFIGTRCPRSQRGAVRCSGDLLHRRGDTGLGHGPGWQQTPVPTRGLSSGLREVEKPRGPAVGEGVSGHGWERWVWAPRQGLLAGGGKISTVKCSVKSRFSGESVLLVPDSLRSGAGTPPGARELNLLSPSPCSGEARNCSNDLPRPDRCLEITHFSKLRGKWIFLPSAAS